MSTWYLALSDITSLSSIGRGPAGLLGLLDMMLVGFRVGRGTSIGP